MLVADRRPEWSSQETCPTPSPQRARRPAQKKRTSKPTSRVSPRPVFCGDVSMPFQDRNKAEYRTQRQLWKTRRRAREPGFSHLAAQRRFFLGDIPRACVCGDDGFHQRWPAMCCCCLCALPCVAFRCPLACVLPLGGLILLRCVCFACFPLLGPKGMLQAQD